MLKTRLLALATALFLAVSLPAFAAVQDVHVEDDEGTYAIKSSSYIDAKVLAANTAETQTVPTFVLSDGTTARSKRVFFASTCNFYFNDRGTAEIPAADVTDGSASELNPTVRVLSTTSFSIIAAESCVVTMMFYR